ncbi:hypothetical protein, partial [Chamaesiphon polymorphus]|uniref:hypothetical protein n=1 Tax=Chamaesiphon polymorphus TaxID=2107691 RepID=UPI001C62AEAA
PSPNSGRRGAGAKSLVSCSLSQTWERAGVKANQWRTKQEFPNLELLSHTTLDGDRSRLQSQSNPDRELT